MPRGRLSHNVKYYGVFTTSKGEKREAYILWDQDNADQGFMIRSRETNKPIRNDRFATMLEAKNAGFTPSGVASPVVEELATVA